MAVAAFVRCWVVDRIGAVLDRRSEAVKPCPLVFEPIFKQRIWGGRKLERVLGLPLPDGELVGEAWGIGGPAGRSVGGK